MFVRTPTGAMCEEIPDVPLVNDTDVNSSLRQGIRSHQPCRASADDEDVDGALLCLWNSHGWRCQ